jgi:hypothetical protein
MGDQRERSPALIGTARPSSIQLPSEATMGSADRTVPLEPLLGNA